MPNKFNSSFFACIQDGTEVDVSYQLQVIEYADKEHKQPTGNNNQIVVNENCDTIQGIQQSFDAFKNIIAAVERNKHYLYKNEAIEVTISGMIAGDNIKMQFNSLSGFNKFLAIESDKLREENQPALQYN